MKLGLILVDIQNDYFQGGSHELINPEQAAMQAGKILTLFREKGWPIFHVHHISTHENADFFLPDTEGSDFYRQVYPRMGEEIIIKHKPDSFLETNLKETLEERGVDSLVICGMMTHMCIDTTVRSAVYQGYPVTLIDDACATEDLEWEGNTVSAETVHYAYMAALNGTFARIQKAENLIREFGQLTVD